MTGGGAAFADGKAPDAMRTIGELADALGLKPHILRYWEDQFPALRPLKRSGGRRLYRSADVELVQRIDRLVNREGYTIKGAKAALLAGGEISPAVPVVEAAAEDNAVLAQLREIRARLAAALAD